MDAPDTNTHAHRNATRDDDTPCRIMASDLSDADLAPAWQQLTLQGNHLFDTGRMAAALERYEQARTLVLASFARWRDTDNALAAVVVSVLNLSEAQARLGLLDLAARGLCSAHANLLRTVTDESLPVGLRQAAHRHLREMLAALARFQNQYGPSPQVASLLDAHGSGSAGTPPWPTAAPLTLHSRPSASALRH